MYSDEQLQHRHERWLIVLGFVALGILLALAIWLSFTSGVSENWPPTALD